MVVCVHRTFRPLGVVRLLAPLVLTWISCFVPGTTSAGVPSEYVKTAMEIHGRTMDLESAWWRTLQREHKSAKPEWFTITLDKALLNRPLQLEIVRSPVIGLWGRASAPSVNRCVHNVTVRSIEGRSELKIALDMMLGFECDSLGQEVTEGLKRVPVKVTVTGENRNGKFVGSYKLNPTPLPPLQENDPERPNPLSASAGSATGEIARPAEPHPANRGCWAMRKQDGPEELYLFATFLEREADNWYERIRALDLMRRYGTTYGDAARDTLAPLLSRPELHIGGERKKQAKLKKSISLDDVELGELDDDLEDIGPAKKAKAQTKPDPEVEKGLRLLKEMAARIQKMIELTAAWEQADRDPAYTVDSESCEDPLFGPWYGELPLESSKSRVNKLPPDAGRAGLQEWRSVACWRAMGPFPITRLDRVSPALPDMILVGGETCEARKKEMKDYSGPGIAKWRDCPKPGQWDFGYIVPPKWFSFNPYYRGLPPVLGYREYQNKGHYGLPYSTAYLRCEIDSPRDVELWAGLGLNFRGRLWLGDRLLWQGPSKVNPVRHESTALFKIPFRKGRNVLTLRLDTEWASPYCWLRLCLRGKPLSAAEAKAREEGVAAVRKALKPDEAVGWRGDGTGMYPGSHPPTAWHRKKKKNVLWHTPLEYFGNATPVPVPGSNRLFITIDPHWLVCLDKDTGKELWRKAVTLLDLLPEPERKKGWALHKAWWKARQERDAVLIADVQGMKYKAPKWLQYQWYWAEGKGIWAPGKGKAKDEREGASPELVALLDKRDELEKAPDPASVQDELNAVLKKIEGIQAKKSGNDPNSPIAKQSRLQKAEKEYVDLLRKYSHTSGMGGGYWSDYCGWMFATPVTDGKHVWLKTGSDVAACFDLDGNEKWKVQTWGSGGADHTLCSPRLVGVDGGRKLFVMALNNHDRDPKKRGRGVKVVALDAATGEMAWEARGLSDNAWNDSTPGVMTLTDGKDVVKVIVTTCGTILRATDGKILVNNPGVQGGFASPLVQNDIVIFGHAALAPVQFVMQSPEHVGFRRLWAIRGGSHGVLDSGGAVLTDGYIIHTVGMRRGGSRGGENVSALGACAESGPGEGWRAAEAYDLAKGDHGWAVPILRKGGNQWSPASVSEKHVYHVLGDHIFQHIGPKAPMDVVVTTRGYRPLRLANNAIDRTYGAGAIEGDRIYLRGYYGATCVGYTGDEGRRYEAAVVARNLLDDIYPEKPQNNGKVRQIPMTRESVIKHYPYGDKRYVTGARNCYLMSGQPPHRWWFAGPVPKAAAARALPAFGGPGKALQGDETFAVGDKKYEWGPLCQSFLRVPGFKTWELDPQNFTDIHRMRRVVDLGKAIRNSADTVCYLMTEFSSDREQTVRFDQTLPGVRAWLAGVEIKHGDRVKFGTGVCRLLLEVTVGQIPPEGVHLSPRFWWSEDAGKEAAGWVAEAGRRRPYLERARKLTPDSSESERAALVLAGL